MAREMEQQHHHHQQPSSFSNTNEVSIVNGASTLGNRSPLAVYQEAVSNAIDATTPYEKQETKVEIFTDVAPDGDIVIEDNGTGIENFDAFTIISQGEKVVRDQVSSYQNVNEKLIGQKGM